MVRKRTLIKSAVKEAKGNKWLDFIKNLAPLIVEVIRIILTKR